MNAIAACLLFRATELHLQVESTRVNNPGIMQIHISVFMTTNKNNWWRKLNGFDLFVIAGGAVNVLVILYLFGYWLLH